MFRKSDVILAIFVVGITAMLLVPLPTTLLDFLLVINLFFSIVLLLAGLYMPNALALLAFPSLLLLTTLFRLSLNVASTRLILGQADAGRVIQAFGNFLISGEVVVGVIIFTIITIVNFIVIARGSSRVSEVAARFALDAMPGKQLAIDADLRAGLINAEEAQSKREDLRKESQLYGAMDGAMKFVQGDAIAGFFIIVTNIIGGMYLGLRDGMGFADAIQTYTLLTVGDGLVHQIPAILISVCAGIVVTRVSSGENASLGSDVNAQIFARPGTLAFAGVLLLLLGFLPGLPLLPFLTVGLVVLASSWWLWQARQAQGVRAPLSIEVRRGEISAVKSLALTSPSMESIDDSPLVVALDASVLFRIYKGEIQKYRQWWSDFQRDCFEDTGLMLPELHVMEQDLGAAHYRISVSGIVVGSGSVPLDALLVEVNPDSADVFGFEVVEIIEHPLTHNRIFWTRNLPAARHMAELADIRVYDFMGYVALCIAAFYRQTPEEVLSLSEVHTLLKNVEKRFPGLTADLFARQSVSVARVAEVLQELVREGLSVRDFRQIIEYVISYCANLSAEEANQVDVHTLVSHIRLMRKRHVIAGLLSARRTLRILTISGDIEQALVNAPIDSDHLPLAIEPVVFDNMRNGLETVLKPLRAKGVMPVTILCRGDMRRAITAFVRACNQVVRVVTVEELEPGLTVEPVGVWGLAATI